MLRHIIPHKGLVQIWGLDQLHRSSQQRYPKPQWLDIESITDESLNNAIQTVAAEGASDIYFTIASFEFRSGQRPVRRTPFVSALRSYAVDLDAHGGEGGYATPEEAYAHLVQVSGNIGLWPTLIVHTGRGVQAYWTLNEDIKPREWLNLSHLFGSILQAYQLRLDRAIQGDRARVMRLPGTLNSKTGTRSYVLYQGPTHDFRAIKRSLNKVRSDYGITVTENPLDVRRAPGISAEQASVYNCPENESRLRYIVERLPPIFTDQEGLPVYTHWRDSIWAIKRTGLPNAWSVALEYARSSSESYDDWYESFERTWLSDKESAAFAIGPGTLVHFARLYGRGTKNAAFDRFRFLTAEDVEEDAIVRESMMASGAYYWSGECLPTDTLPDEGLDERALTVDVIEDGDCIEEAVQQASSGSVWETGLPPGTLFNPQGTLDVNEQRGTGGDRSVPLPDGLKWDRLGRACLYKKPKGGSDAEYDPDAGYDPVFDAPVEYVGRMEYLRPLEGVKSQGYDLFRVYDIRGRGMLMQMPMSEMENPTELLKGVKGHGGEICAKGQKGTKVVSYLNSLSRAHRTAHGNTTIVQQAGWYMPDEDEDADPVAFLLGSRVISKSGLNVSIRLNPAGDDHLKSFGKQKGTLEGQKAILAAYDGNSAGALLSKIYCSWVLGSVLGQFLPQRQAVPYLYTNVGGAGKTSMAEIAYNMWGKGFALGVQNESTRTSFNQYLSWRGALPTFMDDIQNTKKMTPDDFKGLIMNSSQRIEASASNSTGTGLVRGTKELKGAISLSGNVPTSTLLPDGSSSVGAAYRRLLLMRWKIMPCFNTRIPRDQRPPRPVIDGMGLDNASKHHYGHIGPLFIQWVLDNFEFVRKEVNAQYERICDLNFERDEGTGTQKNFIAACAACARVGAIWMKEAGITPGWDLPSLLTAIDDMGNETEEEINNLFSMNPEHVWNSIIQQAQSRTVVVPKSGTIMQGSISPMLMRDGGPVVRLDYSKGVAYMSTDFVRSVVVSRSCDWNIMDGWIHKNYAEKRTRKITLTKGIAEALVSTAMCYVIPLEKLAVLQPDADEDYAQKALQPDKPPPPPPV